MSDPTNHPSPYPNAPFPNGPSGEDPLSPVDFTQTTGYSRTTDYDTRPAGGAHERSSSPVDDAAAAKDKAKDTAQAGKQAASEVAGTATDAAKDVAQETTAQAKDVLAKTRTQVNEQAAAQQDSLVATLRDLGDQLAGMADTDRSGAAVDLVGQARDQTRQAADWLDRRDPGQVVDELRELGRRRPGAFLLGSAVAGVLAGRLTRGVAAVHSDGDPAEPGAHREAGS